MPTDPDIAAIARDALGFELRPEQEHAVEAVVAGRDTLVVMPTGSGKSAIYQVAGLALAGETVVVSPLIALQQDQLDALEEHDVAPAAALHSGLRAVERREAFDDLARDRLEFLLLAPEQLVNDDVLGCVAAAAPSLLVVDEAHCISEWGHDFRPDYLRLGALAEELGRPTVLALTATASPPVRAEIVERLRLRDPEIVVRGFDRPNIRLAVDAFADEEAKREALVEAVAEASTPGIVYAATRAATEELAGGLLARGVEARAYHAGLGARDRERIQEAFMDDDVAVIVATTAFGMGVDKPDVRFVMHHDIPESLDAYHQELGRAGRDGAPAEARLFYRPQNLGLRRFFASGGNVEGDEVAMVLEALRRDGSVDVGEVAEEAAADAARRRGVERSRVEMMRAYAESRDCRRGLLLNYFGEPFELPCNRCDNCEAGLVAEDAGERPFALGARVAHGEWGDGTVQRYEGDKMVVLFDEAGYRTLDVDLVVERDLLAEA